MPTDMNSRDCASPSRAERPAWGSPWCGCLPAAVLTSPSSPEPPRPSSGSAKETGAHGIVGDVGRKEDIYPIALQITGNLGGLDVLVNGASSLGSIPLAPLADTECEELEQALAVNLLGPFRLTKALFGALAASARDGRGAVVVNISSDAAINAYSGWGAYGASKAALRHLTAIWAEEARRMVCASSRSIQATWIRRCMRWRFPMPIGRA